MQDYTWEILKGRLEERWERARQRALLRQGRRSPTTAPERPVIYLWRKDSS